MAYRQGRCDYGMVIKAVRCTAFLIIVDYNINYRFTQLLNHAERTHDTLCEELPDEAKCLYEDIMQSRQYQWPTLTSKLSDWPMQQLEHGTNEDDDAPSQPILKILEPLARYCLSNPAL